MNARRERRVGGAVTPQAKEQRAIAPRGDKSSDAVEALTPESVGQTNFAARVMRTELENGRDAARLENRCDADGLAARLLARRLLF